MLDEQDAFDNWEEEIDAVKSILKNSKSLVNTARGTEPVPLHKKKINIEQIPKHNQIVPNELYPIERNLITEVLKDAPPKKISEMDDEESEEENEAEAMDSKFERYV